MYGRPPEIMGRVDLTPSEMCFVQYMPIKIDGSDIRVPDRLKWAMPLVVMCGNISRFQFAYLTAKYLWVNNANMGNRKGWHSDGFMSDDVNIIWSDCCPTEFCVQSFNLSRDHELSLQEMAKQAHPDSVIRYKDRLAIRVDQYVIHRVSEQQYEGMRAFVKISLSDHRYNLQGNAKNELFDYDWEMHRRGELRNHPTK